jgi:hypothetical protein
MTDYPDLIARLTHRPPTLKDIREAADALEAQARRIAELEAQWSQDMMFENCEYRSEAGWDRLRARIAALEAERDFDKKNAWGLQDIINRNVFRIEALESEKEALERLLSRWRFPPNQDGKDG